MSNRANRPSLSLALVMVVGLWIWAVVIRPENETFRGFVWLCTAIGTGYFLTLLHDDRERRERDQHKE